MLLNMHIKNIALIDDLSIDFSEGLNILTGETGSGKSIILGSLATGLGGKFTADNLRDTNKEGFVSLLFSVDSDEACDKISNLDIDITDGELLIERMLHDGKRPVTKINGNTVTTSKLREVSEVLIDLHSQNEQITLQKNSKHLEIIDDFCGSEIETIKSKVSDAFSNYKALCKEYEDADTDESVRAVKIDFLNFQINEIESAAIKEGEDEEIENQYKRMNNAKDIIGGMSSVTGVLENDSFYGAFERALVEMKRFANMDKELENSYSLMEEIDGLLSELKIGIRDYTESIDFDAEDFQYVANRLDTINSIKSKYGFDLKAITDTLLGYKEELEKLNSYSEYLADLEIRVNESRDEYIELATKLSDIRKTKSKEFEKVLINSLKELNFDFVSFEVRFKEKDFSRDGIDDIEFYISTNVGESIKPLSDIASGGELSRVMLAVKTIINADQYLRTLVFDEIDAGISGITAGRVATKLHTLGGTNQVICITHLPQIAAYADVHYLIEKSTHDGRTFTDIRRLSEEERVMEIARILGGDNITESTKNSAKELIESTKQ